MESQPLRTASSSNNSTHERDPRRQPVPKWVPVSLLALTTACLTVPAVLLWRQRQRVKLDTLRRRSQSSAPSIRRASTKWTNISPSRSGTSSVVASASSKPASSSTVPPPRRATSAFAVSGSSNLSRAPLKVESSMQQTSTPRASSSSSSLFDGPVAALGAFGIATVAVGVAAIMGAAGIQRSMGVENTEQFATRMREIILERLPVLSQKLYGSEKDGSDEGGHIPVTEVLGSPIPTSWSWDAAEGRLREAFDRGGFTEWAEAAVTELEEEGKVERRKRGL